jgi:replicative superfamily II helicase
MLAYRKLKSICALSAVISNPQSVAQWLNIPLIVGDSNDRMVSVEYCCDLTDDVEAELNKELTEVLKSNEQAIIFCRSKATSQSIAKRLKPEVGKYLTPENNKALKEIALEFAEDDE